MSQENARRFCQTYLFPDRIDILEEVLMLPGQRANTAGIATQILRHSMCLLKNSRQAVAAVMEEPETTP